MRQRSFEVILGVEAGVVVDTRLGCQCHSLYVLAASRRGRVTALDVVKGSSKSTSLLVKLEVDTGHLEMISSEGKKVGKSS